jgi:hypothetical protein
LIDEKDGEVKYESFVNSYSYNPNNQVSAPENKQQALITVLLCCRRFYLTIYLLPSPEQALQNYC